MCSAQSVLSIPGPIPVEPRTPKLIEIKRKKGSILNRRNVLQNWLECLVQSKWCLVLKPCFRLRGSLSFETVIFVRDLFSDVTITYCSFDKKRFKSSLVAQYFIVLIVCRYPLSWKRKKGRDRRWPYTSSRTTRKCDTTLRLRHVTTKYLTNRFECQSKIFFIVLNSK